MSSGSEISIQFGGNDARIFINVDRQRYRIAPIGLENISSPPELDFEHTTEIELKKEDLEQSVSAANLFSDYISFRYDSNDGTFVIEAIGDTDDMKTTIPEKDLLANDGGSTSVSFSLEFLNGLCNSVPDDSTLKMKLKENRPGLFEYDVVNDNGHVQYFLAPRIDPT